MSAELGADAGLLPLAVARIFGWRLKEGEHPLYGSTHFLVDRSRR